MAGGSSLQPAAATFGISLPTPSALQHLYFPPLTLGLFLCKDSKPLPREWPQ